MHKREDFQVTNIYMILGAGIRGHAHMVHPVVGRRGSFRTSMFVCVFLSVWWKFFKQIQQTVGSFMFPKTRWIQFKKKMAKLIKVYPP